MSTQSNIMEKTPKVQHKYKRDASDSEDEDENKAVVVKTLKYESVSDGENEESDGEKEGIDGEKEGGDGKKEESDGENEESDGENEKAKVKAKVCKKRYFQEEADAVDEEESEDEVNDDDDEEQEEVEDKAAEEPKYKETWKETVKREFSLKKAITQKKIQDEHDNIKVAKKQP